MSLLSAPHAYRVNRVRSEELDDFITLGSPVQSGYLAVFGGNATPTFIVDANLNSVSLNSDDNTGSVGLLAESGAGYVAALGSDNPAQQSRVNAYISGGGEVWANSGVNVGSIGTPLTDTTAYAALQYGNTLGGRLLTWDEGRELTSQIGSSAGVGEGGVMQLYRGGNGGVTVEIDGEDGNGSGNATWRNASGNVTVEIQGGQNGTDGGFLTLRDGTEETIILDTNSNRIRVFDPAGTETIRLFGNGGNGGGGISLRNSTGAVAIELDSDDNADDLPAFRMRRSDGTVMFAMNALNQELRARGTIIGLNAAGQETAELVGVGNGGGGALILRRQDGTLGVLARAIEGTGSELNLYDETGAARIQLDTDWNGNGNSRIVADEVQITGGADLSEQFDVTDTDQVQPGMVVSIDAENPGKLALSRFACDRKVAGIVSGANGIRTGMYMGQKGSEADGGLPVALTGRVYCYVDATQGAVEPGDMLTTSNTPGHAMKVTDYDVAQGAIIGKAMTGLDSGRGLVLVLVNLQ
ncbi:MAG: hypothetical protein ACYTHJ_18800 [Planctomycetota bacterium]|jgi:hypothetical protein